VLESASPLVSVVIPSYNHRLYVGEAIESVLRSTMQDLEIIVVDDGSVDDSADLVGRFSDKRIKLYRQSNRGPHVAINRGVALASAPWVAILNSDDRFHPSKLHEHLEFHRKHPDLEASASRVRYISESGAALARDRYVNWRYEQLKDICRRSPSLKSSLLVANHLITTSALFVSKQVYIEIGGLIPLRYVHDWFCFLTLAARGRFVVLEQELVDYRVHGRNTIRENDDLGRVEENFLLEWHLSQNCKDTSHATGVVELLDTLKQNRRASLRLILLFQLWRTANDDNLAKCSEIFEDAEHPVIDAALKVIHQDHRGLRLKARARKMLGERLWFVLADQQPRGARIIENCIALLRRRPKLRS
jgi:glycosyltransferase involved in cell wall biosynthesis